MKPSNTIVVSPKYIEEKEHQIADLSKTIERLQEQLNEANYILKDVFISDAYYKSKRVQYLKKWGVK